MKKDGFVNVETIFFIFFGLLSIILMYIHIQVKTLDRKLIKISSDISDRISNEADKYREISIEDLNEIMTNIIPEYKSDMKYLYGDRLSEKVIDTFFDNLEIQQIDMTTMEDNLNAESSNIYSDYYCYSLSVNVLKESSQRQSVRLVNIDYVPKVYEYLLIPKEEDY